MPRLKMRNPKRERKRKLPVNNIPASRILLNKRAGNTRFPALSASRGLRGKASVTWCWCYLLLDSLDSLLDSPLVLLISHLQMTDRILGRLASEIRMPHIAMLNRFFESLFRLDDMRIGFCLLCHFRMLQCLLRMF